MKRILEKINEQIEAGIYHGASFALYDGKWQEAYLETLDGKTPVRAGLRYDLASVSKVVGVGTILIKMVESGVIRLDVPLQTYYPDFHHSEVTIRQLLTHTSGIDPFIENRDQMNQEELIQAINHIKVTDQHAFKYTDINFILLGFMLERIKGDSLDNLLETEVFWPFGMTQTSFGPVPEVNTVPTVRGVAAGLVHDPKAKVLGKHTGSAGLFSTLADLESFVDNYFEQEFTQYLTHNFAPSGTKERSLAWDKDGDWLLHTGYTGTFVMINLKTKQAAIFLSNRTYEKDERAQWILDRNSLIEVIKEMVN